MGGYNPIDDFSFLKGLGSGLLEADKSQLQSPQDGNSSHCKPSLLFAKLLWLHVLVGRDCLLWHACVQLPVTFWSLSFASWVTCSHSMWAAPLYHGLKDAHHYLWCMPCCMFARLSNLLVSSRAAWPVLNQPAKPTALEQRKRQLIALFVCHRDQPSSHTAACVARAACGWDAVAADCRHGSACWSRGALHKHGPSPTTGTHPLNI